MPGSRDVGANIKELNKSKTKRPRKQILAIALSQAREAGADLSKKKVGKGQARAPSMKGVFKTSVPRTRPSRIAGAGGRFGVGQDKKKVGKGQAPPMPAAGLPTTVPELQQALEACMAQMAQAQAPPMPSAGASASLGPLGAGQGRRVGKGQDRPVPGKKGWVMEPKAEEKKEHATEKKEDAVGAGQGRKPNMSGMKQMRSRY